jgi:hypothetical protein
VSDPPFCIALDRASHGDPSCAQSPDEVPKPEPRSHPSRRSASPDASVVAPWMCAAPVASVWALRVSWFRGRAPFGIDSRGAVSSGDMLGAPSSSKRYCPNSTWTISLLSFRSRQCLHCMVHCCIDSNGTTMDNPPTRSGGLLFFMLYGWCVDGRKRRQSNGVVVVFQYSFIVNVERCSSCFGGILVFWTTAKK